MSSKESDEVRARRRQRVEEGDEFETAQQQEENDEDEYFTEAVLEPFHTFMNFTAEEKEEVEVVESLPLPKTVAKPPEKSTKISEQRHKISSQASPVAPATSSHNFSTQSPLNDTTLSGNYTAANESSTRSTRQEAEEQRALYAALGTNVDRTIAVHRPSSSIWQPVRMIGEDDTATNEREAASGREPHVAITLAKLLLRSSSGVDINPSSLSPTMSAETARALHDTHDLSLLKFAADLQKQQQQSSSTKPAKTADGSAAIPAFYYAPHPSYAAALLTGSGSAEHQQYFTVQGSQHSLPYHSHLYYGPSSTACGVGAAPPLVNFAQLSALTCLPQQPQQSSTTATTASHKSSNRSGADNTNAVTAVIFPNGSETNDQQRHGMNESSHLNASNNGNDLSTQQIVARHISTPPQKGRREGRRGPKTNAFQELKQLRELRCFPSSQSAREDHNLKERCRRGIFTVYVEEVLNAARGYGRRRDKITILDSAFNMFQLICQPHYAHLIPQALEKVEQMRLAGASTLTSNIAAATNCNDDACEASTSTSYTAATPYNDSGCSSRSAAAGYFMGGSSNVTSRSNAVLEVPFYGSLAETELVAEAARSAASKRKLERKLPPLSNSNLQSSSSLYATASGSSQLSDEEPVAAHGRGRKPAVRGSKRQKLTDCSDSSNNTLLLNHALYDYCGGSTQNVSIPPPTSSSSSASLQPRHTLLHKQNTVKLLSIHGGGATSSEPHDDNQHRAAHDIETLREITAFANSMMLPSKQSQQQQQQQNGSVTISANNSATKTE